MMKKLFPAFMAALLMLGTLPQNAHAIRLVTQPVKWRAVADAGFGAVSDKQSLAVGVTDTSEVFTTENWAIPNFMVSASATVTDSLCVGWIVLYPDTSVSYTASATSATVIVYGGASGSNNLNMTPMATTTFTDPTTTDKVWRIPIFINPTLSRGTAAAAPGLGNLWPAMRFSIVPIGGVFTACRIEIIRFADCQ